MIKKHPILFIGHGNPMYAIEENTFVQQMRSISYKFDRPKAILCISAHWQTKGTFVTAMQKPKTIHDFGGFPQQLYQIQYPAPGSPQLASDIIEMIPQVKKDFDWGLDHGTWTILKHFYPEADIPVVQLSLNKNLKSMEHFALGKKLGQLRTKGVLIIGSGNIIHNLGLIDWENVDNIGYGHGWATVARQKINTLISKNDFEPLINYRSLGSEINLAIPTPEHYLPLLYILALKEQEQSIQFFNDQLLGGSLSMTSLIIK